ncbi:MAG: NAD(P)-dependent oxidoreductase [Solirubrobacteraceae bacterium]
MSPTIGIIGAGDMGLAICARLTEAGLEVAATDRLPEREAPVRGAGARWAPDVPGVLADAEVLITVLPGSEELEEVMAGAIPMFGPGVTWIDMTTAQPELGCELMARAERRGAECLVATLGGGVPAAHAGTLQLFVGGAAGAVDRHRALLETLGAIEHTGAHGAGYLTKLLVNFLWFSQGVALGEALVLAAREGLDLEALVSTIGRSAAGGDLVRTHAGALMRGDYLASYGLERCCDQLDTVVKLAADREVPHELSETVRRAYRDALVRYGPVDGELLAVARLEERAGVRLSGDREQQR